MAGSIPSTSMPTVARLTEMRSTEPSGIRLSLIHILHLLLLDDAIPAGAKLC